MTSETGKLYGVKIGWEKVIPGTRVKPGRGFLYIEDDGKNDFTKLFPALTRDVSPRYAKSGGMTSQGCKLWLPDHTLFHPVGYHGDVAGWEQDLVEGARLSKLRHARITDNIIIISDGRSFSLDACKIKFD